MIDLSFSVNVFFTSFSAGLKVPILKATFSSRAEIGNYCSFLQSYSHLINGIKLLEVGLSLWLILVVKLSCG